MEQYAREHDSKDGQLYKRDYEGRVIKAKWEMISTHTCRRSAVTQMYDSGLYDVRDMMSISGHTTLTNFETYIDTYKSYFAAQDASEALKTAHEKITDRC